MSESADALRDIALAIERLADEVKVLREVIDEIRDDLGWALQNDKLKLYAPPEDSA